MPKRSAGPPPEPPARRLPLTRAAVIEAAQELVDQDGMEALSMRKLAGRLGVEAMSLYNHVRDKRDLTEAVVNHVLARVPPADAALPWRARIEKLAIGFYETLIRHPAIVLTLLREEARPDAPVLALLDSAVAALSESGLPPPMQVNAFRSIMAMCFGFAVAHTQGFVRTKAEAEVVWAQFDASQYDVQAVPHLAALAPHFLSTRPDNDLRFSLNAYLDALERLKEV